ncbi:hypothetical protein A6R68_23176 [Neotoma lepida]|uniref:Uncharacterized protein n=1 Tax=Neotoma lepida TaxID=56216 RepID=A0A1A6HX64_NEOLE|nr:hypothetical protein A6R68_23176 [Neotoma lepida]
MAEDPEAVLQLPPSAAAAGGESLSELSPETATPEPPSSAAVSPGTEEPPGDTKKKSNVNIRLWAEAGGLIAFLRVEAHNEANLGEGRVPETKKLELCMSNAAPTPHPPRSKMHRHTL